MTTLPEDSCSLLSAHYVRLEVAGRTVLETDALEVHAGELLYLRGENGAGKPIPLRAVAGEGPHGAASASLSICQDRLWPVGPCPHRSRAYRRGPGLDRGVRAVPLAGRLASERVSQHPAEGGAEPEPGASPPPDPSRRTLQHVGYGVAGRAAQAIAGGRGGCRGGATGTLSRGSPEL